MDRDKFLADLFLMYPQSFTEFNVSLWRVRYEMLLSPRADYDRLNYKFITTWKDMRTPPSPADLSAMAKEFTPINSKTLDELDEAKKTACPPPADFMDRVKSLQKKMSMEAVL